MGKPLLGRTASSAPCPMPYSLCPMTPGASSRHPRPTHWRNNALWAIPNSELSIKQENKQFTPVLDWDTF
ncbi:MAG: hypothetical protein ACHBN1_03615 [Heteroscytonema crispum UTEX LB 1556]